MPTTSRSASVASHRLRAAAPRRLGGARSPRPAAGRRDGQGRHLRRRDDVRRLLVRARHDHRNPHPIGGGRPAAVSRQLHRHPHCRRARPIRPHRPRGADHRWHARARARHGPRLRTGRSAGHRRQPGSRMPARRSWQRCRPRGARRRRAPVTSATGTRWTPWSRTCTAITGASTCSSTMPACRRCTRSSPRSPEELFDKVIAVNLKGPFRLAALVGERMVEGHGGSIINVSSTGP